MYAYVRNNDETECPGHKKCCLKRTALKNMKNVSERLSPSSVYQLSENVYLGLGPSIQFVKTKNFGNWSYFRLLTKRVHAF
jgi:hypothetical protein